MGVEDKAYLKVSQTDAGPAVTGRTEHVAELKALYDQRGLPCRVEPGPAAGEDTLLFPEGKEAAQVAEVLESYKSAKGS